MNTADWQETAQVQAVWRANPYGTTLWRKGSAAGAVWVIGSTPADIGIGWVDAFFETNPGAAFVIPVRQPQGF